MLNEIKTYSYVDLYKITTHNKDTSGNQTKKMYEGVILGPDARTVNYKVFGLETYYSKNKQQALTFLNTKLTGLSSLKLKMVEEISNANTRYIVILTDAANKIQLYTKCSNKGDLKNFDKVINQLINGISTEEIQFDGDLLNETPKKVSRAVKAPKMNQKMEFLNKLKNPEFATSFVKEIVEEQEKNINKKKTELKVAVETMMKELRSIDRLTEVQASMIESIKKIPYPYAIKFQEELSKIRLSRSDLSNEKAQVGDVIQAQSKKGKFVIKYTCVEIKEDGKTVWDKLDTENGRTTGGGTAYGTYFEIHEKLRKEVESWNEMNTQLGKLEIV